MKTLLLMRHAKSSWDDPELDDHDRPLNARGLRDAPRMAAWLIRQEHTPGAITSSTALRAVHTAQIVAEACRVAAPVRTTAGLYHADIAAWQRVIRNLPEEIDRALCVGHNPGIESIVSKLTDQSLHMPTAAIAVFALKLDSWAAFKVPTRYADWHLWRPKDLPDEFGRSSLD